MARGHVPLLRKGSDFMADAKKSKKRIGERVFGLVRKSGWKH